MAIQRINEFLHLEALKQKMVERIPTLGIRKGEAEIGM